MSGNGPDHKHYLFIVDDEPNFSESLQIALEDRFVVSTACDLKSARESLHEKIPDVILLDIRLPDGEGIDLLHELKELNQMPVVIVMTAYATVETAIKALKEGAVDYFTKPLDIEKLKRELGVYLENKILQRKVTALDIELKKKMSPFITSGTNELMKKIVDKVPVVAPLNIPILLNGETGTGKEKLANWIHELSGLKGPLVAISCAALARDILESELFGYVKGAFSGAVPYKEGLIEIADGGTLFLDEIGELSEDIQAKFLRVIENGVYYKLGDTKERKARFRLITATNKDLGDPVNRFRQDLFYRINGIVFTIPPLRDRKQDIPLFISAFIREANQAYNKNVKGISSVAVENLMKYNWPGNIRELKWCIHRAVAIASRDVLESEDISAGSETIEISEGNEDIAFSVPFKDAIELVEKKYIEHALASTGNNRTAAAGILGISVRSLHYKIEKYNLLKHP